MDPEYMLGGVLRSVLLGGRKPGRRALRYLAGGHRSIWTNPATILTAAGVAWGIYDTLTQSPPSPAASAGQGPSPAAAASQGSTPTNAPAQVVPPIPTVVNDTAPSSAASDAVRMVQLAVSAANADGVMNEKERAAVLQQAQAAGVGEVVASELEQRRPLAQIVAGVTDPAQRATLYVLAFTILRADEQVTGAERIYLAQLAHLLDLDPATVQRLEKDAGERIDALGDQGQLGG